MSKTTLKIFLYCLAGCSVILFFMNIVDFVEYIKVVSEAASLGVEMENHIFRYIMELLFYALIAVSSISIQLYINDLFDSIIRKYNKLDNKIYSLKEEINEEILTKDNK